MEKAIKPQKRDKSLVPLSREHHFGLLFCWKLKAGLKNKADLQILQAYVTFFWKNILQPHCQEEEWLIKRFLPSTDALRERLFEEHRLLEWMIDLIGENKSLTAEQFQTLEQGLNVHIRWEERELFPYLQVIADADELELAGQLMALHHKGQPVTDDFMPAFWEE
ncbi:hemerythrin domain-containing protein [Rufibacter soli]